MNVALNLTAIGNVVDGYVQTLIYGGSILSVNGNNFDSVSLIVFG